LKNIENKYSVLPNEKQRKKLIKEEKEKLYKESGFDLETVEEQLKEFTSGRKIKPFFLWNLYFSEVFQEKGGFDVVIANPPYLSHDRIADKYMLKRYVIYEPFSDLYCYFIERSICLLKTEGILCFITSNSYIKADYGKPLRQYIATRAPVCQLLNIEDSQVFESAIINVAIIIGIKDLETEKVLLTNSACENKDFRFFVSECAFFIDGNALQQSTWTLAEQSVINVKNKISKNGTSLEDLKTFIRLGLATGANEAFLLNRHEAENMIQKDLRNKEIIKPVLRGRDIDRYILPKASMFLILAQNGVNIPEYRIVYNHLDKFGTAFKKRGAKGQNWWNLRACSFYDKFKKPKIVWIELTDRARFTFCEDEIYVLNSAYFMIPPKGMGVKYLTAVLNSKCITFFFKQIAATSGMGTTRWINAYVKQFPIPTATSTQQLEIEAIVTRIIALKKRDLEADVSDLEAVIDRMVYELYGLTEEEIKIVEGESK